MTEQPTTPATDDTTSDSKAERSKLISQATWEAQKRLRKNHEVEFNDYMVEEAAARGIDWRPKPTAAEKAAKQITELLEQHPELRDRFEPATTGAPVKEFTTGQ